MVRVVQVDRNRAPLADFQSWGGEHGAAPPSVSASPAVRDTTWLSFRRPHRRGRALARWPARRSV